MFGYTLIQPKNIYTLRRTNEKRDRDCGVHCQSLFIGPPQGVDAFWVCKDVTQALLKIGRAHV